MPRKPEPSFELKKIIWGIAVKVGKEKHTDILRQLDYELEKRRKEDASFYEDTPDIRTISRIVKEINKLEPEVIVASLPPHVWKLRDDYENINQLAAIKVDAEKKDNKSSFREEHLNQIRSLLELWSREIRIQIDAYKGRSYWWASKEDKLFPYLLQHCPSVKSAYEILMEFQSAEIRQDRKPTGASLSNELQQKLDPFFDRIDPKYTIRGRIYYKIKTVLEDIDILSERQGLVALSQAGIFVDEIAQYRKDIENVFSTLFNNSNSRRWLIENQMRSLQASLEFSKIVNTCLTSSEYMRHKCDWCP